MKRQNRLAWLGVAIAGVSIASARAGEETRTIQVRNEQELRAAMAKAGPGTRVLLAPGEYRGNLQFSGVRGEAGRPIVVAAADPRNPPVFAGGGAAMHFVDPAFLELRDLVIRDMSGNGINIDDGGTFDTPAHGIVLHGLTIRDIGPEGNRDGIKMSGVTDFRIEGCTVERWGTGGGSGIDMVGCHRGVIEGNVFRHNGGSNSAGVQAKGGSSAIAVRGNRFENAGDRGVNIGGSTGIAYFRPPLGSREAGAGNVEAKAIVVEGNTFIGGGAPAAFVSQVGGIVRFNTIYRPKRYVLRILQESRTPDFARSREGEFSDNIVAFRADEVRGIVNIGPDTAPETFRFARNAWYCLDRPERSTPSLPSPETGGLYGKDPQFRDAEAGDLRLKEGSPAVGKGAEGLRR